MVILPMRLDLSLGPPSEDTHRKGSFSRFQITNSYSTYRLRQPGMYLTRQNFCISQQNPVAQGNHITNLTFTALPMTSEMVGSSLAVPGQSSPQLSGKFDIGDSIHCTGALLGFHHSFEETNCREIPFYVLIRVHSRTPVA